MVQQLVQPVLSGPGLAGTGDAPTGSRTSAGSHTLAAPDSSTELGADGGCRSSPLPSPPERRLRRCMSEKIAFGSRVPGQSPPPRQSSPRRNCSPRQRPSSRDPSSARRSVGGTQRGSSLRIRALAEAEPAASGDGFLACQNAAEPERKEAAGSLLLEVNREFEASVAVLADSSTAPFEKVQSFPHSVGTADALGTAPITGENKQDSLCEASLVKTGIRSQNNHPDSVELSIGWSDGESKEDQVKCLGRRDAENRIPQRNCIQRPQGGTQSGGQGQSKPKGSVSVSSLPNLPAPLSNSLVAWPPGPSLVSSRDSSRRTKRQPNSSRPGSPMGKPARQASNGRRLPGSRASTNPTSSPVGSRAVSRRGSGTVTCGPPPASRTPTRPNSRTPLGRTPAHTPSDWTPAAQTPADRTPAVQTPADRSPCQSPESRSPVHTPPAPWPPAPVAASQSNLVVKSMQQNFDQAVEHQWQLLHRQWPLRTEPDERQRPSEPQDSSSSVVAEPSADDHVSAGSSAPSTPVSVTLMGAAVMPFSLDAQDCGLECPREPLSGMSTATPFTEIQDEADSTQLEALSSVPSSAAALTAQASLQVALPTTSSSAMLLGPATTNSRLMSAAEFDELVAAVRGGSPRAASLVAKPLMVLKAGDDAGDWSASEPSKTPGHPSEVPLLDKLTCPVLRRRSAEALAPRLEITPTSTAPGVTTAPASSLSSGVGLVEASAADAVRERLLCACASPTTSARRTMPVPASAATPPTLHMASATRSSSSMATVRSPSQATATIHGVPAASPPMPSARSCVRWAEVHPLRATVGGTTVAGGSFSVTNAASSAASAPLEPATCSADVASTSLDAIRSQPPSAQAHIGATSSGHNSQASSSTMLRSSMSTPVLPIAPQVASPAPVGPTAARQAAPPVQQAGITGQVNDLKRTWEDRIHKQVIRSRVP